MGWRDRLAKALALPPGTTTVSEQQALAQSPQSGMLAEPLERRIEDYTVPFAPGRPLFPALINPPREDGRTAPRRYEFPVAWNLQITEQRVVPFRLLRDVADGSDLVRKCIEVVKAAISGMDWDISPQPEAVERLLAEDPKMGSAAASRKARELLAEDTARVKDFWKMPDRINGLSFPEWVAMAVEEMLVIDALSIYPNKTLSEDSLHSLEILDGATIKPLLDDRGSRPIPPHPAFQQILWGFPRGEFTASADADGEFTVDDLIYAPRTRRPFTPYGYSAVERALPVIDLYMKRLQWLRTEFTDGVVPDMLVKTDANYGSNPELLRGYEQVFNDALAGKTEERRRARLLPAGFDPIITPGLDVKYRPDMDEYLVKQVCSHFGVLPTQIGFSPKGGLGGEGVQEGEAMNAEILGMRPIVLWLTDLLNQLSYRFLGMPRDLGFTFALGSQDDELLQAQKRQIMLATGEITLNEARSEIGRPLFTFPEADMPMISQTFVPVADVQEVLGTVLPGMPETVAEPEAEQQEGLGDLTEGKSVNPMALELDAFRTWAKSPKKREFMFEFLDADTAKALNALAKHDPPAARDLAVRLKNKSDVAVGDFVSWGSSGGRARGEVIRVIREGSFEVPDSSFRITAKPNDPAVVIRVWEQGPDGWRATDTRVGHLASTLTSIEALGKAADTFTPPKGVREAAQRALEWVRDGRPGGTAVGKKRAADLARGAAVSRETLGRMRSFFARHEVDKKAEGFNAGEEGFPSPGRVAWDLWGGDAGQSWVDGLWESVKHEDGAGTTPVAGGEARRSVDSDLRGPLERFAWAR